MCEVKHPETMEQGKPKLGGLLDPHMGTVDRDIRCMSCSGKMADCPGHFGNIKLVKPMYHVSFINAIIKVLQCVCFHCSKLKADDVSSTPFLIVLNSLVSLVE